MNDEIRKNDLTEKAKDREANKDYSEAATIWKEIAKVCHRQGKERDAYVCEHTAYLLDQYAIYEKAHIDESQFTIHPPYTEILKVTLRELADKALADSRLNEFHFYQLTGRDICECQGKYSDVRVIDNYLSNFRDPGKMSDQEIEECWREIVKEYEINHKKMAKD